MEIVLIVYAVVVLLIVKVCASYDPRYRPDSDPEMFHKLMYLQTKTERKASIKTEEAKLTLDILRLVKDGKPIVYEPKNFVVPAEALEGLEDAYKNVGENNPCIVWVNRSDERIKKYYEYINAWLQHDKNADKLYREYQDMFSKRDEP